MYEHAPNTTWYTTGTRFRPKVVLNSNEHFTKGKIWDFSTTDSPYLGDGTKKIIDNLERE